MNNRLTECFVLRSCSATLGIGLMLPNIDWLRPLGLLIVIACAYGFRYPSEKSVGLNGFFTLLVLIIFQVVLALVRPSTQSSITPSPIFTTLLVVIWLCGLITEYRKWRSAERQEAGNQPQNNDAQRVDSR